jgi:hypothetical protein
MKSATAFVQGRIWFFGDEEHEIELWVHEVESMDLKGRSSEEWAREHFNESYQDRDLRKLFEVPLEGDYQIVFKGTLRGSECGPWEAPTSEWDEEFDVEETVSERIPEEYVRMRWGHDGVQS